MSKQVKWAVGCPLHKRLPSCTLLLCRREGHDQAMFGFSITTYAGRTKQDNTFRRSWAKFYAENRLRTISKLIEQAHRADDELRMWIERTAAEIVPKLLGNGHLGGRKASRQSLSTATCGVVTRPAAGLEAKGGSRMLYSTRAVVMCILNTS
jgi:Fructosamine kinase